MVIIAVISIVEKDAAEITKISDHNVTVFEFRTATKEFSVPINLQSPSISWCS